ncbi:Gfo/Idh/MocA family protein, partial [Klebsiella pneumoniae]
EALRKDGRSEIVVVYDIDTPTDATCRVAPSIEAIVNDPEVDTVVVCLPNHLNRPTTIAALKAGKNVFCEKPPAFNAAEVREIMAAEAESDRVLMYGFNHRHHAGVDKLKQIVDSGAYGRVLWMRGRYGKSVD